MIKKYEGVYGQKLATTLEAFTNYCKAEGYHQDYLTNNPHGYECPTHFERTEESLKKQFKT